MARITSAFIVAAGLSASLLMAHPANASDACVSYPGGTVYGPLGLRVTYPGNNICI